MRLARARRAHAGLVREIERAIARSADAAGLARRAPELSAWSVGQHLEHAWRADLGILAWLERAAAGTAASDGGGPTAAGRFVLLVGRIPRGRGRAPERTLPAEASPEAIASGLGATREAVLRLAPALPALARSRATLRHPALGCLDAVAWLRFAGIHHAHHRRLVEAIERASGASLRSPRP